MSSKKRRTTKSRSKAKSKTQKSPESKKIDFAVWFNKKVLEKKLNFWQEKEILTFFSEKGLSDREEPEKYEEALKLY